MRAIATESAMLVRQLVAATIWMLTLLCPVGAIAQSGLDSPAPIGPFLDGTLPTEPPGFDPNAALTPENYFPALTFVEPIRIIEHPSEDQLIIISKDGTFWLVNNVPGTTEKTLFLDLSDQIQGINGVGEGGVGGFVFHPEYGNPNSPNKGYVYVWYRWSPNPGFLSGPDHDGYERLSRFAVPDGQTVVDPSSELILIQQFDRSQNHIGGDMFFGTDGFLYLSVGDEGNNFDRSESTQKLDGGLFSGILRIDVDKDASRSHPIIRQPENVGTPPSGWPDSFTQEYYIPDDNPFVDPSGGQLEEFYALGLRHPWTVHRDPDTGVIWAADVGQDQFEEVDIIQPGHNYQWAYKEGKTGSGLIPEPSTIIGIETPPIWDYDHNVGHAIIGGGVYRGSKHADLFGKYLVSDFLSGKLWSLEGTSESDLVVEEIGTVPAGFPSGINSYLLDRHGRILMAKTAGGLDPGGTIQELVADGTPNPEPPMWLSQTAAFDNVATLDVHDGCIPYDLIEPFWSDAALKSRWLCLPNDGSHDMPSEQIVFSENGEWQFPVGTVLIKHFEILLDESDPASAKRLETRFVVHSDSGYYGITYKWLADESDAELLTTSVEESLTIVDESGTPREQTWHYPSRAECLRCHNSNAGSVLGPKTRQLNKEITYPSTGITANQLSTMEHLGMFDTSISDAQIANFLTMVNSQDQAASLEDRARTYLDSNCGYCHRPGGVRANFDTRYTVPLTQQGLLYGELQEPTGVEGEAVIVPGNLELSRAYQRTAVVGVDAMPPLAKNLVDDAGASVLANWIDQVGVVGNSSDTDGPFLDAHHPSLYFNEADVLTNSSNELGTVTISEFRFFARQLGNPVTPIVAKKNGDNSFEVVAIGTTRLSSEYQTGENRFPFDENEQNGSRVISLQPGETLITGFSDSVQPGGTGWGAGPVIPADTGSGEDEIWALLPDPLIEASEGFVSGVDTPSVEEGEDPLVTNQGKSLNEYTSLERSYRFGIVMALETSGSASGTTDLVENGSFEEPTVVDNNGRYQIFQGSELPGWTIPFGDVDVVSQLVWSAADGSQSLDLNGNTVGAVEQAVLNLSPSGEYVLSVKYAAHFYSDGERSADVKVNGALVGTLSTATKVPAYSEATFNVQPDSSGTILITIESTSFEDSTGLVIDDVKLEAVGGNSNPVIEPIGDQTSVENDTVSLSVSASDPDGDSLTYSATGLPPDLAIDSITGQISGTLATGSQGSYTVTVTVEDGNGGTGSTSFGWTVDPPSTNTSPSISSIADQTDSEGDAISLQVSGSDPDGDTLTYSATGLPADLAINSSTGLISGTLAIGSQGSYSVFITVDDGNGGTANTSFNWTVNPSSGNTAPSITSVADQSNLEGDSVSLQVDASDPDGDTLTYSAAGLPPGLSIDSSTGLISGTLASGSQGGYSVTVAVDDGNGGTASTLFDWAVTVAGGGDGSIVNGSFEDPVVTANNGSHQYFTGSEIPGWLITGDVDIVRDAFQAADGSQALDLNGNDAGSVSQTVTGLTVGSTYQLSVQWARHPFGPSGVRSADVMVNGEVLGSLTTSTVLPPYNLSNFDFTPAADGSAEIAFVSTSPSTSVGIVIDGVQIGGGSGNNAPSVSGIADQSGSEGDAISLQVSASDPDGDTLAYQAVGLPPDLAIDSSTGLISGTLATGSEGTYSVIVSVDDGNGGTDSTSFNWEVNAPSSNTSPSISSIAAQTDAEGDSVSLQVDASDPDGDTLTYSAAGLPAGLSIDSSTGLISGTLASGSQGTYSVTVAVDDGNGGTASTSFDWTVTVAGGGDGSIVNGSFEDPVVTANNGSHQYFTGSEIPGWLITGDVDIVRDAFQAADGSQALDLNGNDAGSVSQTVTGLTVGSTYQLSVQWARHPFGPSGVRSADVMVNGEVLGSLTTSTGLPPYNLSNFDFTPAADGSAEIAFVSTSPSTSVGIVIDDVQVTEETSSGSVTILNGDFETDGALGITTVLTDWAVTGGNVEILEEGYTGTYALDLNGSEPGTIEQVISGLTPGSTYTLYLVWADQAGRSGGGSSGTLATGEIYVDGVKIGDMRTTADAPFFVDCNGFSFVPTNSQVTLQIKSTMNGAHGLLIDAARLETGGLPQPPSSTQIVNGGFESPLDPPDRDPHVCGFDLPGWLVTKENVDVVTIANWEAPEGASVLDLGGHGPGGIAQTVTGLTPGTTYRLSFQYARHEFWTQVDPLTADVLIDGAVVLSLSRDQSQAVPNWEPAFVDFVAPADGEVTIGFESTSLTVGGSVIIDDVDVQVAP